MTLSPSSTFTLQKRGVERSLSEGHPWVYRDAIAGNVTPGTVATLRSPQGTFLARGLADEGPIALRVFSLRDEPIDRALFSHRLQRACELRDRIVPPDTTAYRLLNGEGDRLPGFVCDVYCAFAVLKTDGAGAFAHRETIAELLRPLLDARGVKSLLLRESARTQKSKDTPKTTLAWGALPTEVLAVQEHGMTLLVDLLHGQKTGLFLDQREARRRVRSLSRELRTLNLYAYTGGFSVSAGLGGASSVESVDVAAPAISLAERTWEANKLPKEQHVGTAADVPERLAALRSSGARFGLIIADPPSFAPNEAAVPAALASYQKLHTSCLQLLQAGGYYVAGSCSSHVDRTAFERTVLEAARRTGRTLQHFDALGPPADHPRPAAFVEGEYLKVLCYRVE